MALYTSCKQRHAQVSFAVQQQLPGAAAALVLCARQHQRELGMDEQVVV